MGTSSSVSVRAKHGVARGRNRGGHHLGHRRRHARDEDVLPAPRELVGDGDDLLGRLACAQE